MKPHNNVNAYAAIKSNSKILGIIKSIKEDRITFQYIADTLIKDRSFLIDIAVPKHRFSLSNIAVEQISDDLIKDQLSFSGLPMRRMEVKFTNLDITQKEQFSNIAQKLTLE